MCKHVCAHVVHICQEHDERADEHDCGNFMVQLILLSPYKLSIRFSGKYDGARAMHCKHFDKSREVHTFDVHVALIDLL